ncbi:hypothetical protein [Streptomyces sp. NPDC058086]|uniref:hypothetical protein n=1 Tax=Streptomyces sp. NPDC058086 TaxID=3346334 RepID=UPI0036F14041
MTTFPTEATADDGDGLLDALGGCTVLDCRLRVVRTDGWSWGPDPSELARGAVALLPRVLRTHLAGALHRTGLPITAAGAASQSGPVPQDLEVTVPVHIRAHASLGALSAAATGAKALGDVSASSGPGAAVPLHHGHAGSVPPGAPAHLRATGSPTGAERSAEAHGTVGSEVVRGPGRPVSAPPFDRDRVLVGLLHEASACGALDTVLARLGGEALRLLLSALDTAGRRTTSVPGPLPTAPPTPAPGGAVDAPGAVASPAPPDPDALTTALLAALRSLPSAGRDTPRTVTPTGPEPAPGAAGTPPARPAPVPGRSREERRCGPASGTITDIDRALPFLLLPPLHDRGYLQALTAVLTGGGARDADGAAFAACLAHKVLPPPVHGWLRAPRDAHAVAVFAGATTTAQGTPDTSPPDLERRLGPLLPLLDARLGLQAAQGHTATSPLLLHALAADRLLLLDLDGLYPVWEAARPAELLRPWELADRPLVLLPARSVASVGSVGSGATGLTHALDVLGIGFVTDLPPARGERLSRVPGPRRCWTNTGARLASRSAPDDALVGAARRLTYEASRAARLVEALVELRPAVRTGQAPAVERSTTLAVGVALADLAWTLWSQREAPDPVDALDRFADLGARVMFHDSTVEIRLPLGARHADLYRHRLLADVPDVPWFGGRTVVFTGG